MKLFASSVSKSVLEEILRFDNPFLHPFRLLLQPFSMQGWLSDLASQSVKKIIRSCGKRVNGRGVIPCHPEPNGGLKLRLCSALLANEVFLDFWFGHSAFSGQQAISKQVGTALCNQSPTGFAVIILAEEMNHPRLP